MAKKIMIFAVFLFLFAAPAMAQDAAVREPAVQEGQDAAAMQKSASSGLPIPRFVSLASDKVFVRTGPALRYPIKWVYQREHLPVEIIQEFDTWRKIRDMDGDDGWIHQSLLSGDRYAVVKGEANVTLQRAPVKEARPLAQLEPTLVARVNECKWEWCQLTTEGYTGWAERKFLWGIYDSEDFD